MSGRLFASVAAIWALPLAVATPSSAAPAERVWGGPSIRDIVEQRTFDGLSVSPDGRHVAYRIVSRSLATDSTSVQWFVQSVDGAGPPRAAGRPTEPAWVPMFSLIRDGVGLWAPDSQSLYVLEIERGQVQVHCLTLDGRDEAVTSDPADVESFSLSPAGDRLDYRTRAPRAAIDAAIAQQKRDGLHFDRTVATEGFPLFDNHRIGDRVTTMRRIADDDATGEVGAGPLLAKSVALPAAVAPPPTNATTTPVRLSDATAGSVRLALGTSGARLRLQAVGSWPADGPATRYRLVADLPDGRTIPCPAFFCDGPTSDLRELAVDAETREAVILYEHDSAARTALYAWNPATGGTRTIHAETGSLDGGPVYTGQVCPGTGRFLVCVESGPTRPQRLVRIDLSSGRVTVLADPNMALAAERYPETRFIRWTDHQGRSANGVLVLPYDRTLHRPPLMITSYRCRGYLSGGVAALAPEFVAAERGMAALCVNFNSTLNAAPPDGKMPPLGPHKAALDAYAAIIEQLDREGVIDRTRVGVAGHSFSANVVAYGISHTDLFRAAVVGSGTTIDPGTYPVLAPAADSWRKAVYEFLGLPRPEDDPHRLWPEVSPALNAPAIRAPLLMQPAENEYLFCLQHYAYAQDAGAPTDMYIYPGEGHLADMMPLHQYWRDRRSIDWFDFWLNGHEDRTAETDDQFRHWETLRASAPGSPSHATIVPPGF